MKAYRYKLYTKAKDGVLDKQIDRFGIVYNHCIALHRKFFHLTGKMFGKYDLMTHLARIKHRPKWKAIFEGLDAQAVQNVAERIDKAYKLFFRNLKHKVKASPPKFKRVKKYTSYTLKQCGYKFDENKIRLNGRWYGFHKSRDWKGKVKTVTIKRDRCGDFWLIVTTDWVDSEILPKSGKSVGYDFGMKHFLTDDEGNRIDAPLFMQRHRKEQRKLHRALSRKKLHSCGWRRCKTALARFNRKIANQREDFQWKLARDIVKQYDVICVEDLNLTGMAKFRFGRKVGEYGFASFVSKLEYLAAVSGKSVVKVGRYYASSQLCHECGYQHRGLTLKDREWTCPKCGAHHDRDRNAAMNILREGTSSRWRDSASPNSARRVA